MTATILVVDDLEQNIRLLEAKLNSEYYNVLTANNGQTALNILKEHSVDIILLDVMMPEMDGFETCRLIKSDPDTTHIPVVMVTALSEIEDRVKGLEAGADEFLTKPINDTALFSRIRSLTRMKTLIDELKLRNKISEELGGNILKPKENFVDCKIAILDDDIIQAKNIKNILIGLTAKISILSDHEKLTELAPFTADLIIISCQLDSGDPLRAATLIRSKPVLRHSVIMLLAEEDNLPKVIKGLELGVNDYFIYPVDKSELIARIKTQLRRKIYQDNLRAELEETIDLSTKDGLTGLFNRRYFDIHLSQMTNNSNKTGNKISMLMIDIDHFKQMNDNYGHPAGDAILKTFANILKSSVRITDLIARYGGEEFVVLIGNANAEIASRIAEKIRAKFEAEEFYLSNNNEAIIKTVSIGVGEYINNESIEEFTNRVDSALYKAKELGRNKVIVS